MLINYKKILLIKIIIIIYLLFFNINIISYINIFFTYLLFQNEIKRIEKYLTVCNSLNIAKKFKKYRYPKISIISAIYNKERFILRLLSSIQNQNFNNIEIILIDDCSSDNSAKIIKEYKKRDERIILIKNKKNKGTFVARNIGVLYSKGKYLIFPDPDDIISKNILKICFNYSEKYKFEIIRFTTYDGIGKIGYYKYILELGNKPVFQPELSTFIFYGYNELDMIDYTISNKFIKKEVFLKSLYLLKYFYLNIYMTYMEDSLMNYLIHRTAKSLYFSKIIGYYYLQNTLSMTKNTYKISLLIIKFIFIYLKIVFEYSKNKKFQKDMANFLFTNLHSSFNIELNLLKTKSKTNINFYYNILNIYLKNEYITNENKYLLKVFKSIIEAKKKNNNY